MNAEPHTHRVEVKRRWLDGTGAIEITYGDTQTYTPYHLPFRSWRIRVAIRRAIKLHDKAGKKATKQKDDPTIFAEAIQAVLPEPPQNRWASEVMK